MCPEMSLELTPKVFNSYVKKKEQKEEREG